MTIKNRLTGLYQHEVGLSLGKLQLSEVALWVSFFLAWLCLALPGLRYLSFTIPFLTLVCCLGDRMVHMNSMSKAFLWYAAFGLALWPLDNAEGKKDLVLATSGVSIALLGRMPQVKLWTIFNWYMAGFLIYFGLGGAFSPSVLKYVRVDILNSYSTFESNYAFVFCLLLPFAAHQRRWGLFLLTLVMSVLTLKRIALLGGLLCTGMVFMRREHVKFLLSPPLMVLANVLLLWLTMFYSTGHLEHFIHDLTGLSGNALGQGRESLQRLPSLAIINDPELFLLWGKGAGRAYDIAAASAGMFNKVSLHSDPLKIAYEYGMFAFCVFFWLLYQTDNHLERIGMAYLNMLLITDNVLTYYFILFFVAVTVRTQCNGQPHSPAVRVQPSSRGWQV
ncbi:MAG: hypothetical protein IV110_02890 [Aquabacterium sp.]|uniref:hypothetical protein n=1 Tax=Aquabacterium sp. TaxID=1872578 RepID=UPI001D4502C9|nr:hypothetical protein [Aquabacterium sp.]MBT9608972.1 hypothetical protein [Aquabacterium sp.]